MPENAENAFLETLRQLFATTDPAVLVGGGPDDCAHLAVDGQIGLSVDAFAEGSHFLPDTPPEDVARKVFGASLSDLAASGCGARWVLLTACFRKGLPQDWPVRYAAECARCASAYGVTVVGGDTITGKGGTCLTATVIGTPMPGGPVLRSSAKPGDVIVVTGKLGGSILGKHFAPIPRFAEMRVILQSLYRSENGANDMGAGMDISDGLALDLSRMCRESGVGAVVEDQSIPISDDAMTLARSDGKPALEHAYSDGEDFELLLTLSPKAWEDFQHFLFTTRADFNAPPLAEFSRIGLITEEPTLLRRTKTGQDIPLTVEGFEHTW